MSVLPMLVFPISVFPMAVVKFCVVAVEQDELRTEASEELCLRLNSNVQVYAGDARRFDVTRLKGRSSSSQHSVR